MMMVALVYYKCKALGLVFTALVSNAHQVYTLVESIHHVSIE
jgi:hypothetical protein